MTRTLVLALTLVTACSSKKNEAVDRSTPEPTQGLVQAMIEYCRIGELPREKQPDAQRAWGFQFGGDKDVGPIWNRAARDHDPRAIRTVYAAADRALGKGKCPILDVLGKYEPRP